jgi:hypothetical protein
LLGLAFLVGAVKGFRKVSWTGLTWLAGVALFALVGMFMPKMEGILGIVVYLILAIACGLVTMVLFKILLRNVRPRVRWVKDDLDGDTSLAQFGLEFEPEYLDYDGEDDWQPYGKRIHRTGFTPPNFAFRLIGGLTCAINVGIILWAIASAVLLAINATSLAEKNIGLMLQSGGTEKFLKFSKLAFFEVMSIGLVILVAKKGYVNGWLNTIRVVIVAVGTLGLMVLCMYLPFSKFASQDSSGWHFLVSFVNRCIHLSERVVPVLVEPLGKIMAGCFLSFACFLFMIGLNIILKHCCRLVSKTAPTRIVDTVLSCLLYMVIGAAICVAIWFVLAAMDYCDLFYISKAMSEDGAHLSNGLYNFGHMIVEKLVGIVR